MTELPILPIRGRGASTNPPNRFDPIVVERDTWTGEDDPLPRTRFYRDATRAIIATNDSPDVGFDASVNPYRGCEHGCVYCLAGDTAVLMGDGTTRPLAELQPGDRIYGTSRTGWGRRLARTVVRAHWQTRKPAHRVVLADGRTLVASGDHRFLTTRGWRAVAAGAPRHAPGRPAGGFLAPGDVLQGTGRVAAAARSLRPPGPRPAGAAGLLDGASGEGAAGEALAGTPVGGRPELEVQVVEPLGEQALFDITTGTGDFIAEGVVSHNCYARPGHEYFGLSAGLDFETRVFVKEEAPELLRKALASPRWEPRVIALSGVTDPYQPVERRLRLTRRCLEVLAECMNPVGIVTKNHLVTRDADLLAGMAAEGAAAVTVSVTSLRTDLQRVMEPRTSIPARRLAAIEALSRAGVPVGVNVAPVIPGLTDHELPAILEAAADAGAVSAGYVMLRLPFAVAGLFEQWLGQHFPDRKEKVLNRLRSLHGGRLYDPTWRKRQRGGGAFAHQVKAMFEVGCRKAGLGRPRPPLSVAAFRRPGARPETGPQLELL